MSLARSSISRRLDVADPAGATGFGTVLGIWAHPDDETYLSGGLMTLARRAGRRVVCATATLGEHGTSDPRGWPPTRLAKVRDRELRCALDHFGVGERRLLGFEDGTLDAIPLAAGAAVVDRLVREVRPDTIVTFGPDGITGHPDHRAISHWVRAAWTTAGRPCRLLRATTSASFVDEFASVHARLGVFEGELPVRTPDDDLAVAVHLDDELQDVKLSALLAHASQVGPVVDAIGVDSLRSWWRTEMFVEVD